jgi:hypothetical protein
MPHTSVESGRLGALKTVTSLAATTAALRRTLVALAACHGGKAGAWLDGLEAQMIRDTKNIVFNGTSLDDEAAAVEGALATIRSTFAAVRQHLS